MNWELCLGIFHIYSEPTHIFNIEPISRYAQVFHLPRTQPFLVNLNKMISPVITKWSKEEKPWI